MEFADLLDRFPSPYRTVFSPEVLEQRWLIARKLADRLGFPPALYLDGDVAVRVYGTHGGFYRAVRACAAAASDHPMTYLVHPARLRQVDSWPEKQAAFLEICSWPAVFLDPLGFLLPLLVERQEGVKQQADRRDEHQQQTQPA